MDTKTKRAAALGYSLPFLIVLPVAEGAISIESAGHALSAYSWDLETEPVAPSAGPHGMTGLSGLSGGMFDQRPWAWARRG